MVDKRHNLVCPYCLSKSILSKGKGIAGYTKVKLYECQECHKLLTEGEIIKRPICEKCGKPMRIKGRKTTKRKVIYYACDRCGNYKAIGETREAMAERSPICQKCGAKNMIRREYKNGKKVFQCKKCGKNINANNG